MKIRPILSFLFLALLLVLFSACSGDTNIGVDTGGNGGSGGSDPGSGSDGGVIGGTEAIISGEWSTSATEVLDTCGFDPFPSFAPMLIEESGSSVTLTLPTADGFCDQSVRARTGDIVMLEKTDVFDAGCGIVQLQSTILYEFTDTTFSGTSNHRYTTLDGFCSNTPCQYNLAVAGTRCDNCWTGCSFVQNQQPGIEAEAHGVGDEAIRAPSAL